MIALYTVMTVWIGGELYLQHRTGHGPSRFTDPTYFLLSFTTFGSVGAAFVLASRVGSARIAAEHVWFLVAGLALVGAGVALRLWAVATLGRFFTYAVGVQEGQEVVDTGPYARIRHPSYTGLLVGLAGLGLALDNWLSLAVMLLLPLVGVVVRIRVEEEVMSRELGEAYRSYARHTARLVPGVW
jgi:protein-S-isoprenylcysteine O-methyltransferase Ste14